MRAFLGRTRIFPKKRRVRSNEARASEAHAEPNTGVPMLVRARVREASSHFAEEFTLARNVLRFRFKIAFSCGASSHFRFNVCFPVESSHGFLKHRALSPETTS